MQHRTALITAGSIVGVVIAGVSAVAAGMGILDRSSDSPVGQLSAETPAAQVVDVYVTDPPVSTTTAVATTASPAPQATVQSFTVEHTGTVALSAEGDQIRLADVVPSAGWTWELRQSQPSTLVVALTNGPDTYELAATAAQGIITANATLLNTQQATPATATANAAPPASWHDDEDDHEEREHDEEHEEEQEGADDDD